MAQLTCPIEQASRTDSAICATAQRLLPPSTFTRTLQRVWQWACSHAERPERVVPYC